MTTAPLFDRLAAPAERLLAALSDSVRRERTAVIALVAYVAVWTLYGVLAKAGQDLHFDMTEMLVWSRELALGYPKHPPLAAWLVAAWFAVFPVAGWSFYLLAMSVAGVALWIVWKLAGDTLAGDKRVLALVLMTFVPFFNFHALKYNANTILLPLWAATALCFLRSYEKRSLLWAALAGLFAAASMLGKYWSLFLLLGLGLAALLDTRRTAYFKSAAPWVTIGVGTILVAPHAVWLLTAEFSPLTYATAIRSGSAGHPLKSAGGYLVGALAYSGVAVLVALAAMRPGRATASDARAAARRLGVLGAAAAARSAGADLSLRDHLAVDHVGMGAVAGGAAVLAAGGARPAGRGRGARRRCRVSGRDGCRGAADRRPGSSRRRHARGDAFAASGGSGGARMAPRYR
jgi:hypothetical protein